MNAARYDLAGPSELPSLQDEDRGSTTLKQRLAAAGTTMRRRFGGGGPKVSQQMPEHKRSADLSTKYQNRRNESIQPHRKSCDIAPVSGRRALQQIMDEEAKRESRRQKREGRRQRLLKESSKESSMQSLRSIERQLDSHCLAAPSASSRDNSQRSLKSCLHKSNSSRSNNSSGMRVSFSRDDSLDKLKMAAELNLADEAALKHPSTRRESLTITDLEDSQKAGEFYVSFSSLDNKSNGNNCNLTTNDEFLESLRSLSTSERDASSSSKEAASGEFYVSFSQIK